MCSIMLALSCATGEARSRDPPRGIGVAIHLAPVRAGDGLVILEVEVHGAPHSIRVALEHAGVAIAEVPAHGELGQRNWFPLVCREHPLLDIA